MAAKSIIEIDVNDSKFKAFQAAFEKYQKTLDEQSKKWSKVNKALDDTEKKIKSFNKTVSDGSQGLKNAANTTADISRNMSSAAFSAAKWVALAAAGGGFGLGKIAENVSDVRKRAAGYGVSSGALRAAGSTLGRFFDPESVIGNIGALKSSIQGQAVLGRLGADVNQDPAKMLPEVMRKAVQLFKQFGEKEEIAKELGLLQVFSLEDLKRMASMTERELESTITKFNQASQKLDVSDKDSESWRNFFDQMKESGQIIETSMAKGFVPLIPILVDVTKGFAGLVSKFGNVAGEYNKGVAGSYSLLKDIPSIFSTNDPAEKTRLMQAYVDKYKQIMPSWLQFGANSSKLTLAERNLNPGNLRFVGQEGAELGEGGYAKFGSTAQGFLALQRQLQLYASGGSKAAGYKKLDTLQDIISLYAPPSENNTEAYIKNLESSLGKGRGEHLNLNDPGTLYQLMSTISRVESGKGTYSPQDIKVMIENNTGGNANTTVIPMNGNQAQ